MAIHDITSAVNTPFHLTPLPENTKKGFQVSGIYLFSREIFSKLRSRGRLGSR
jgi:UTP-glucose-1-phosphate uridylyltransferase